MILHADARSIPLHDESVQCVVTSPPYWGLRDYGIAGQIGLEPTPEAYVATMVNVFREVWRVLKDDGVVWLNLGDSYANDGKWGGETGGKQFYLGEANRRRVGREKIITCLKPKDLIGIPWRVAFALQADGWYLRSDIIWAKPNPMPESVTDRPTRSHEYLFLLAKSEIYYYDQEAIKEPTALKTFSVHTTPRKGTGTESTGEKLNAWMERNGGRYHPEKSNKRDVWIINSEPTPEAHFATFPQKLVEPCILAGSRVGDYVFDPFIGSGTVGKVAERLGRRWVGLELSREYITIAQRRTAQMGLLL